MLMSRLPFWILVSTFLAPLCMNGIADSAPKLTLIVAHYECLWWSEQQMEGLDPNHPPRKETPTRITKWEYSDPVAVPHPDVVTLVAQIPSEIKGDVRVAIQWKRKKWSPVHVLKATSVVAEADGSRTLRADIAVDGEIRAHRPGALRSVLLVGDRAVRTIDLPIELGD